MFRRLSFLAPLSRTKINERIDKLLSFTYKALTTAQHTVHCGFMNRYLFNLHVLFAPRLLSDGDDRIQVRLSESSSLQIIKRVFTVYHSLTPRIIFLSQSLLISQDLLILHLLIHFILCTVDSSHHFLPSTFFNIKPETHLFHSSYPS